MSEKIENSNEKGPEVVDEQVEFDRLYERLKHLDSVDHESIKRQIREFVKILERDVPDRGEYLLYHLLISSSPETEKELFDFPEKYSVKKFLESDYDERERMIKGLQEENEK